MRFVVIGGDAAGMSAASLARRRDSRLEIIVLEQTFDVSYSACGMPYNIADPERSMDDLVVREAKVFRDKLGLDLRLGHRVTAVDPGQKQVTGVNVSGESFTVGYDSLLLATGASPVVPELPGAETDGVQVLKSLEQGRDVKESLIKRAVKRVVIVGMGYIAMEMADVLRARGIAVDMVKPRSRLLPWLDEQLAAEVYQELEKNRVGVYAGHEPKRIERTASGLKCVCPDLELDGEMVLLAVGVKPNSELAAAAGIELGAEGAVAIDGSMRTSHPDVYAAGDCAEARHLVTGRKAWFPLALVANRGGRVAAENVTGGKAVLEGIVGTAVFKVFDLEVARTGITAGDAAEYGFDPVSVTITSQSKAHAHPGSWPILVHMVGDRLSGRLLGAQMVGREGAAHRINALAVALHNKMQVSGFAETDLAYAPPFGPVWDPTLIAARQLLKKMQKDK
ncbi:MAG: FAD-dependent oxidoreductase [Desulfohalobiaceae bacterium]|nr:FAD-dependent oxidoreductase [Desulfohalobiaceae bacterium]